jgi:peptidoglycan/xylan/chitin deacetylase (PgdA/CDA1 family)
MFGFHKKTGRNPLACNKYYNTNLYFQFTFFSVFGKLNLFPDCREFLLLFMKLKSRRNRKKNSKNIFVPIVFLTFSVLILGIFAYSFTHPSKSFSEKIIPAKALGNIKVSPPPTPVPSPTPTPSPTPAPLVGYCLNVPVLMYHHIQPNAQAHDLGQSSLSVDNGRFDQQMGYLISSGYSFISAEQLIDALVNHIGVPNKSIVVISDDGYSDFYTYAYPVLQKYHILANLAVITGLVGGSDYVTWGQVEEMAHSGLVTMLNHTWSHYAINNGTLDKINYEIATAKQQLIDHTSQAVDTFVYPFGSFNSSAISALQSQGIRGAFSEIPGHWQCDSFVMALHRTRIGNSDLSYYGF